MCFISMYSVLNTLLQYTYFYISKSITSYTFLLVFKIVVSLHCVSLKELHKTDIRQHWFALHFSPAHTQRNFYTGNKSKLIVKQLCLQLCQQIPSDRNPSSAGQIDCQQYFSCIHHICFIHMFPKLLLSLFSRICKMVYGMVNWQKNMVNWWNAPLFRAEILSRSLYLCNFQHPCFTLMSFSGLSGKITQLKCG